MYWFVLIIGWIVKNVRQEVFRGEQHTLSRLENHDSSIALGGDICVIERISVQYGSKEALNGGRDQVAQVRANELDGFPSAQGARNSVGVNDQTGRISLQG